MRGDSPSVRVTAKLALSPSAPPGAPEIAAQMGSARADGPQPAPVSAARPRECEWKPTEIPGAPPDKKTA